jgi:hypothetical protein
MSDDEKYPECAKEQRARKEGHSQEIGEFLEWLTSKYDICELRTYDNGWSVSEEYVPVSNTMGLLYDYFEIDPKKLDKEKTAILAEIRSAFKKEDAGNHE